MIGNVKRDCVTSRAVRFQKFYLGSGSGFFGTEKPRFGFGYFQKRRTVQMYELIYVFMNTKCFSLKNI